MTKEEINDLLEMNYENNRQWLVNYIFYLESEKNRYKNGLELAQELITNSVSKERYNNILRKYKELLKKNK